MGVLPEMDPARVVGDHEEFDFTYHDGSSRHMYVTDIETPFPQGKLIVSRTDLDSNIIMVNEAFVYMSAYTEEELIGAPHHILRHPMMPHGPFQDMWDTIQGGKKWRGYVVNHRADGGLYWTLNTIIPNIRNGEIYSYTSVRRMASRKKVAEITETYRQMKAEEGAGS